MKTLNEIKSSLSLYRDHLFSNYPIKTLAIFGSFARNEQKDESDLDLLVEFNDTVGIRFIDLADEIENYLGLKVDLVSRKGIKEKYFHSIKSEMIYI